jgi:hypothetical protein
MDPTPDIQSFVATAIGLMREGERYAAVELLARHEPLLAASVFATVQTELYWKHKDLPAVLAVLHAGIQHGLTAAATSSDPSAASALRGRAKAMAYNLGSFTWPGWDEPGITISLSELAVGLDAARLNCRLAKELGRTDDVRASALWLLGAHQMAGGTLADAAATFRSAETLAAGVGSSVVGHMLRAYAALADLMSDWTDAAAAATLNAEWDALAEDGTDDALEYARQIRVARNWFGRGKGCDGPQLPPSQP